MIIRVTRVAATHLAGVSLNEKNTPYGVLCGAVQGRIKQLIHSAILISASGRSKNGAEFQWKRMPEVLRAPAPNPKAPWLVLYVAPVGRDSKIVARRDLCGRDESAPMGLL